MRPCLEPGSRVLLACGCALLARWTHDYPMIIHNHPMINPCSFHPSHPQTPSPAFLFYTYLQLQPIVK